MTLFILFLTILAGLYNAWAIGANDVANAMGTSVGSKALTFKQAVVVAAIFEFSGSVLVGSHVSNTIRKSIVDISFFANNPDLLMYGMCAALLAAAIWLNIASYLGWPVSTTHSIVGAVIGFGINAGGFSILNWGKITQIVLSWLTSPVMGGIMSYFIFKSISRFILNTNKPLTQMKKIAWIYIFGLFFVISLVTLFKGLKNLHLNYSFTGAMLLSFIVAIAISIVAHFLIKRLISDSEDQDTRKFRIIEKVFGFLQIVTASTVAFAHGANDVANAVGPMSAVISIFNTGTVLQKVPIPMWVLVVGGIGIVIGLATFGYRVIKTVGHYITELTPTRGFSAEFGAAITILVGSRMGIPLSTTHVLVGCVIGVGFARGMSALNFKIIREIIFSWLITLPFTGFLTIFLYKLFVAIF